MLKALVGSFAAFLAALFLSAASALGAGLAEQAHHHPDGLPGRLRRRRRRPHAAALAREVARPAPGHRLQARRRRQRRLGGRRAGQARRLHLPARHGGDARRQRRALPSSASTSRPTSRRSRPSSTCSNVLTINPDGDRRQERQGLHRQGEGGARQVQLRLDRQRHGHASRLRRVQRARPASTWCTCPTRAGPTPSSAVLKGEICCIFNQVQTMIQHAKAGKVRLLGVTTEARGAMPDMPTIDEAGLPGYESYIWFGIFGPKGLDPAIAAKMNAAIKVALDDPEIQQEADRARQHAALRDARAVQGDGEARPRQMGRGREGRRREDRLMAASNIAPLISPGAASRSTARRSAS